MGYWSKATKSAIVSTWPHLKGRARGSIAFLFLRTIIIYAVASLVIWIVLGANQVIEEGTVALAFGLGVLAVVIGTFVWNLLLTPGRIEKEREVEHQKKLSELANDLYQKGQRLAILEEERLPKFNVVLMCRGSGDYEANELSAWANLKITNTSPSVILGKVKVQISDARMVSEGQGERIGSYVLLDTLPKWSPSNVYWSGTMGGIREFERSINPCESQHATIAYHHKNGTDLGTFNTLNHPPMLETKIMVEISSSNSSIWRGEFYIEYQPRLLDRFKFVEWSEWSKGKNIIEI